MVGAVYLYGSSLYACFVAVLQVDGGYFVFVCFCPSHIHAHEHFRPVLTLCASCAGVYLEHATHGVSLLAEHLLQFKLFYGSKCSCVSIVDLLFGYSLFAEHLHCNLHLFGEVVDALVAVYPALQRFNLFHLCFCCLCIVPKAGGLCAQLLLFYLNNLLVDGEVLFQRSCSLFDIFQLIYGNHYFCNYLIIMILVVAPSSPVSSYAST